MNRSEYLTLSEFAKEVGLSRMTVSRRVRTGEIKAILDPRDHRQKLIPRIEAWRLNDMDIRCIECGEDIDQGRAYPGQVLCRNCEREF